MPTTGEAARTILTRCVAGELALTIALMQLVMTCGEVGAVERTLDALEARAGGDRRARTTLARLRALLADNLDGVAVIATMLRDEIDPASPAPSVDAALAQCRRAFDRLVRLSPEASVALYSLGSPAILAAATAEIVERFAAWGLLGSDRRLLDIGCGIGRLERALAPRVAAITGIDVAPGMIEEARRRCDGLPNVRLEVTSGRDLAAFADRAFEAVVAVDSFPYLYAAGIEAVATHLREAARVLRLGGDLVILNLSYRGDIEADRRDVHRLARQAGLAVLRNGERAFRLWDGLAFHLRRDG